MQGRPENRDKNPSAAECARGVLQKVMEHGNRTGQASLSHAGIIGATAINSLWRRPGGGVNSA
jgi:hypothetical protein